MGPFSILAGLTTGIVLGLFGSGGSIIALPALMYLLHVEPKSAIAMSLGVLTGLVGVGGGFLIVPALVLLSGIPMKQAVGTSLAIVAAKSYAGFIGYMGGVPIDWTVMGGFTAVTVAGSFIGARFSTRLSQDTLKKAFAWFLVVVATYILFKSVIGA